MKSRKVLDHFDGDPLRTPLTKVVRYKELALSEDQLCSHAHLTLSQIVRHVDSYLSCINASVAKGNARIALDMIRLIFLMIPPSQRDRIITDVMSSQEASELVQNALHAISPKPPSPPSQLLQKSLAQTLSELPPPNLPLNSSATANSTLTTKSVQNVQNVYSDLSLPSLASKHPDSSEPTNVPRET